MIRRWMRLIHRFLSIEDRFVDCPADQIPQRRQVRGFRDPVACLTCTGPGLSRIEYAVMDREAADYHDMEYVELLNDEPPAFFADAPVPASVEPVPASKA